MSRRHSSGSSGKSETPSWRPLLLAGWGLYTLSFLLPGFVIGAVGASALGLGAFNLLRPLPLPVDGDRFMYGHLGTACWVWSASFALVAVSLWLRDREWAPGRPRESMA